jgi:hypothetical protein
LARRRTSQELEQSTNRLLLQQLETKMKRGISSKKKTEEWERKQQQQGKGRRSRGEERETKAEEQAQGT